MDKYSLYTHIRAMWGGRRWKFKSNNRTIITFNLFRAIKKFFHNNVSKDITPDYLVWETERKITEKTDLAGSDPLNVYTRQNPRRHVVFMEIWPNLYNN